MRRTLVDQVDSEGAIDVLGTINASDVASTDPNGNATEIGGSISLMAGGSVVLEANSELNVSALNYNNAGKGGAVSLEAGSDMNGVACSTGYVDIVAGSTIDLSVAAAAGLGDRRGPC